MSGFLAIGECMVELSSAGDRLFRMGYAGDTFNAVWYARRLLPREIPVAYGTAVGTDDASDGMLRFMEEAGIGTQHIRRIPDRTVGLYMIHLHEGERSFSYWRGQSAARRLADDDAALDAMLAGAGVVLFSGITLAILPPEGREALAAALARASVRGTRIAFDGNLRLRLWRDRDEARQGMALGASVADVALPSFEDEAVLHGDPAPEATLARYRAAGAGEVVVKNGVGRLLAWTVDAGEQAFHPEPVARVVDTTAAGDSFDAAFLTARMQGATLDAAVHRAMAVSARVVQARGALVDLA